MSLLFSPLFLKFDYLKIRIIFTSVFLDLGFQFLYLACNAFAIYFGTWYDVGAN